MAKLEELEAENERLKAERRRNDEENWTTLFKKVDDITAMCATFRAEANVMEKDIHELKCTVYGKDDSPGLKGKVAELCKENGLAKWSLGAAIVAFLTALAAKVWH